MLALFLKSSTLPMQFGIADIQNNKVTLIDDLTDDDIMSGKASQNLLFGIDTLLNRNNITYDALDAIFVASGPGSYTSARLLVAIVKTIAIVYPDIKIYDASLLNIFEKQSSETNYLAVTVARKNKYYVSGFINEQIIPTILSTDELILLLENNVSVNGVSQFSMEQLSNVSDIMLDWQTWFDVSDIVKNISIYEPYYLENVKIG